MSGIGVPGVTEGTGTGQITLSSGKVTVSSIDAGAKTGYSLTAGSYSIRATSYQRGTAGFSGTTTTADLAISAVTLTRATAFYNGARFNSATIANADIATTAVLNSTTTGRIAREVATDLTGSTVTGATEVQEHF